ncbi:MAG: sulfatase-like hydrolase/transferase, partial [bacterium]|nr:sulfatase-like hydrolase/transferase [bacterium]
RTPETIRYRLKLPSRPRLDLELGTLAPDPVTFHVAVTPEEAKTAEVFASTITTPQRWETARVDLSAYAGEWVDLTLGLSSARPGALGLWGSPAIRNLGGRRVIAAGGQVPRGVIVVIADNLRADHLEAYGYHRETAPVLTRMATAGTRFENCTPLATWTKISVPSILTSLEPLTHGVLRFSDRLPPSAVTLAEVFRDAGHATVAYFSNLYAGQRSGTQQGFEVIHDDRSLEPNPLYWSKTARQYVDRLRPWLEAHREVPFFVLLHVLDPHYPFEPLPPYDRLWSDPERKAEHQRQARAVAPTIANPFMRQLRLPTRTELEEAEIDPETFAAVKVDWYDGSIRGLDVELGRLLEGLRQLGLEESTLIAVISDHGEEFYEHGRLLHGHSVYGELTRVPLILRGPGVPAGVVVPQMVRTIDLMPTVLELSGLSLPEGIQGQSLVPLLQGDGGRFREQPALITRVYPEQNMQLMDTQIFALAAGGWKLVEITERNTPEARYELYDLSTDPLDTEDLAARRPEVVERLQGQLARWRERAAAQRLAPAEEARDRLSAEALERLRALGYIR